MGGACINEEHEGVLKTCYSRINRLSKAGVWNKHAGIQGMPAVTEEEQGSIMKTILALKGHNSKKQREAFEQDRLWVKKLRCEIQGRTIRSRT